MLGGEAHHARCTFELRPRSQHDAKHAKPHATRPGTCCKDGPRNLDVSSVRNTYTRLHTFLFILLRTQVVRCFDRDIRVGIIKRVERNLLRVGLSGARDATRATWHVLAFSAFDPEQDPELI